MSENRGRGRGRGQRIHELALQNPPQLRPALDNPTQDFRQLAAPSLRGLGRGARIRELAMQNPPQLQPALDDPAQGSRQDSSQLAAPGLKGLGRGRRMQELAMQNLPQFQPALDNPAQGSRKDSSQLDAPGLKGLGRGRRMQELTMQNLPQFQPALDNPAQGSRQDSSQLAAPGLKGRGRGLSTQEIPLQSPPVDRNDRIQRLLDFQRRLIAKRAVKKVTFDENLVQEPTKKLPENEITENFKWVVIAPADLRDEVINFVSEIKICGRSMSVGIDEPDYHWLKECHIPDYRRGLEIALSTQPYQFVLGVLMEHEEMLYKTVKTMWSMDRAVPSQIVTKRVIIENQKTMATIVATEMNSKFGG